MQMPSFMIPAGEAGIASPQEVERKRLIALALMRQGMDTSPTDMWGGAARLGQSVVGALMNRKADKQERAGRDDATRNFNAIMEKLMGPQMAPAGGDFNAEVQPSPYEAQGIPDPRSPEFTVIDDRELPLDERYIQAQPQQAQPAQPQPQGNELAQQVGQLPMQEIIGLLNNPYLQPGQAQFLQSIVQNKMDTGEWRSLGDGRIFNSSTGEVQDLGQRTDARAKLGLNPQYGVDAEGNPVLLQIGDNGEAVQTQMPEGVTLSKEPIRLDAGTHFVLLDPITRQPVGQIPKDVAGEAAAQAAGKEQGGAIAQAPAAKITAEQTIGKIDEILADPNLGSITGWQAWLPDSALATTQGAATLGLRRRVEQLKGTAFLEAYNGLRGGGQITEVEGKKAEDAIARLETAQSDADYIQALKDFRDAVAVGYQKLAARAGGNAPALNVPPQGGGANLKQKYGLE